MSTHARYHLWVGVRLDALGSTKNEFVDRVLDSVEPVEENELSFSALGMHGEPVGIGVEVLDFSWETVETGPSEYDSWLAERADALLPRVSETLKKLGIDQEAKTYHHIDLGG